MKTVNTCPNCGGHIEGNKCPYCDAVFDLPPSIEEKFSERTKENIYSYISTHTKARIQLIAETFYISVPMAIKYLAKLQEEKRIIKVIKTSKVIYPHVIEDVFYEVYVPKHKWSKYKKEIRI